MSLTQAVSSVLLLELLAVLALVPIAWGVLTFLRKRRDRAGVQALIAAVHEHKEENKRLTLGWLEQKMGLEGSAARLALKELDASRMGLFQHVINLYLTHDAGKLADLAGELDILMGGYQALQPVAPEPEAEAGEDDDEATPAPDSGEATHLQQENKRLAGELRISQETIGRMLDEYAAMFSGEADDQAKEALGKAQVGTASEAKGDGEVEL